MYAQLLPLALPTPQMPGIGGGGFGWPQPPPAMRGMRMLPMPPFGMPLQWALTDLWVSRSCINLTST